MDSERLRPVIEGILALPTADRPAAIAAAAAGDAELRAALERALRDVTEVDPSSMRPDSGSGSRLGSALRTETLVAGEEIVDGSQSFRLVRRLPGGGLGEVWVAEQTAPVKRRVAMKFIRDDRISKATLERFENERRLLASFDHPNIARYYGAGRYGERPWIAMEFVDGDMIDAYCLRNSLTVKERIRLVQQVARAVQYAHDREVVHRDLKPHNILVTNDGVPKLLDFGIAKILKENFEGPRGITSDFEPRTDEYASPEQLQNLSSTTRSDVYALGVLLYELLTDQLPYHVRTRVREAVLELKKREPPPPMSEALDLVQDDPDEAGGAAPSPAPDSPPKAGSTGAGSGSRGIRSGSRPGRRRTASPRLVEIARRRGTKPDRLIGQLRGNLDNIVLKAMRIEPMRRYESPQALAADLENHLEGLPVAALPESAAARLSRVLVRYRWVVAGTLVTLAAVVGVLLAGTLALRNRALEAERGRIEAQRTILRSGFDRVMRQIEEDSSRLQRDVGETRRLKETLQQMETDYAALAENGGDDAAAVQDWIDTGEIRRRLAVIACSPANRSAHMGQPQEAEAWRTKASDALRRAAELEAARGADLPWSGLRLSGLLARERGDAAQAAEDHTQAERHYAEAEAALQRAAKAVPPGATQEAAIRRERTTVATKLADTAQLTGRLDGLIAARELIVSGYRNELRRSDSAAARVDLSIGLLRLGEARELADKKPSDMSHQCFEESVEVLRPVLDARTDSVTRRAAMESMVYLADRLLVRADEKSGPAERDAADRRRADELLVEAVRQAAIMTFRAPEEARSRSDLLRLQQLLMPAVGSAAAISALEMLRAVRIEPDLCMVAQGAQAPTEAAETISSPASRAMRMAYGNRLAAEWLRGGTDGQPSGALDAGKVEVTLRESWELARSVAVGGDSDLSLLVEAQYCLALAGTPKLAARLWANEPDRSARIGESLALARALEGKIAPRVERAPVEIKVAHYYASECLKGLDPQPATPSP